ncbi:MAG: hypothetical protein WC889_15940 [Myxococcota bacterium]|jgi:hypothetical protein
MSRTWLAVLLTILVLICSPAFAGEQTPPSENKPADNKTSPEEKAAVVQGSEQPAKPKSFVEYRGGIRFWDRLVLKGYIQLWYRIENAENGITQSSTGIKADDISTGFIIHQARTSLNYNGDMFGARLEVGFESGIALMDCYAWFNAYKEYIRIFAGQMKIPSTYEVEMNSTDLDFATMSMFSDVVPNWQLSKHSDRANIQQGIRTYARDIGASLKGSVKGFDYFFMVSNGLGANLGIGASEGGKGWILSNDFGAYFYGLRVSYEFVELFKKKLERAKISSLWIASFGSYNYHRGMLYAGDGSTVLNLNRVAWDVEAGINFDKYVRLTGMYGECAINDNYLRSGKADYSCAGWEFKVMAAPIPNMLEAGFRIEGYKEVNGPNAAPDYMNSITLGVSYRFLEHFRLDADYRFKRWGDDWFDYSPKSTIKHPYPNADNFILFLQAQF